MKLKLQLLRSFVFKQFLQHITERFEQCESRRVRFESVRAAFVGIIVVVNELELLHSIPFVQPKLRSSHFMYPDSPTR